MIRASNIYLSFFLYFLKTVDRVSQIASRGRVEYFREIFSCVIILNRSISLIETKKKEEEEEDDDDDDDE